jgi:hypothetical protein
VTANQLTYFTCTGQWYDVESPSTSGSTNKPQFLIVSAFVEFTPRLAPGDMEYITNLDLGVTLAAPSGLSATGSGTGGSFAAGTYFWVITAIDGNGETTKSNEVQTVLTGSTSSVALSWSVVDGAAGYNIYRGTSTTNENKLITSIGTGTTLTYTDTGTAGTTQSPPATNTAERSANTSLALAPVLGRIYSGELQTINQAGTPNIQLVANSSVLGLSSLIYDVSFTNVVYASAAQVLKNFAFTAPTTASIIDLSDPSLTRLEYNPTGWTQ